MSKGISLPGTLRRSALRRKIVILSATEGIVLPSTNALPVEVDAIWTTNRITTNRIRLTTSARMRLMLRLMLCLMLPLTSSLDALDRLIESYRNSAGTVQCRSIVQRRAIGQCSISSPILSQTAVNTAINTAINTAAVHATVKIASHGITHGIARDAIHCTIASHASSNFVRTRTRIQSASKSASGLKLRLQGIDNTLKHQMTEYETRN
jgi:hypothetical protein